MTSYDITGFMTWWVAQVISIVSYCWNTLDSIQFAGTSLLRVLLMIIIFGALFKVTLTIPQNIGNGTSERRKDIRYDKEKYLSQERAIQEKAGLR